MRSEEGVLGLNGWWSRCLSAWRRFEKAKKGLRGERFGLRVTSPINSKQYIARQNETQKSGRAVRLFLQVLCNDARSSKLMGMD